MKKLIIILTAITLMSISLFIGYCLGNKVGQTTGAQQYTKKLFASNELSISTGSMLDTINKFRESNGKKPLQESNGICRLAYKRAELEFNKQTKKWDQTIQEYNIDKTENKSDISIDQARNICPECVFKDKSGLEDNYYGELDYIVLRPDVCMEINQKSKLPCKGDEGFGLTEHYQERILKQWIETETLKPILLLDNYNTGCVQSFGGSVVFSIGVKK